ncbi:hypothetical protein [Leptolyngbya boryana]|uniref:hypothetical protein n=1 Tax=Leptolyngbya boryana TaxID=1184 RepID=UPI0032999997
MLLAIALKQHRNSKQKHDRANNRPLQQQHAATKHEQFVAACWDRVAAVMGV